MAMHFSLLAPSACHLLSRDLVLQEIETWHELRAPDP